MSETGADFLARPFGCFRPCERGEFVCAPGFVTLFNPMKLLSFLTKALGPALWLALGIICIPALGAQPQLSPGRSVGLRPLAPSAIPDTGTFWLLKGGDGSGTSPPLPALPPILKRLNLPVYNLGGGTLVIDDTSVNYAALAGLARAAAASGAIATSSSLSIPLPGDGDPGDGGDGDTNNVPFVCNYIFNTNGLWLELTNVANGMTGLNLHNATNSVYAIWSTTNPLAGWQVEAEVWPSNSLVMPITFPTLSRPILLMRAEDWTGVNSYGDGLPDWWNWLYFGNLSQSATNLDSQGNTLLYDYTNGLDPNVIAFSLSATNRYVNQSAAPLQVALQAGTPSYYAVLVNDTNPADANWQPYSGTNLTANLASVDGVYAVSVGLRGLPSFGRQTWQTVQLIRDTVPPTVVITAPQGPSTARPTIQLQGYATEPLSAVSYDLTNALGSVSRQPGYVKQQYLDPTLIAFTTNWIQCYDIDLAAGLNRITLRATDWAGNTTTTNFNLTLDYSTATNPVVQVVWPPNGAQICAGTFTCRGTLDDPTATVTGRITDTNGNVNLVIGAVGRDGNFWVENLPLNGAANVLTIAVTNAAGLATVTNLTLGQGALTLTMNAVAASQLWQPTLNVTGMVSDATCTVSVNGTTAVNHGDGTWSAVGVSSSPGGMAAFDLAAQAAGLTLLNNTNLEKPAQIVITRYEQDWTAAYVPNSGTGSGAQPKAAVPAHSEQYHLLWIEDVGTTAFDAIVESDLICTTNYTWPADEAILNISAPSRNGVVTYTCSPNTDPTGPPGLQLEHCHVSTNLVGSAGTDTYTRAAQTSLTLFTGGKGQSHLQRLFQVTGSAFAITNLIGYAGYSVPPTGVVMGALGPLGLDGNLWVPLQDNDVKDVTDRVLGTLPLDYYSFTASQIKYKLRVLINGTQPLAEDRIVPTANYCVGQGMNFSPIWTPSLPAVPTSTVKWSFGGTYVNDHTNSVPGGSSPGSSEVYFLNPNRLSATTVTNWWVSGAAGWPGAQYSATVSEKLTFANGQQVSLADTGLFAMYRPTLLNWTQAGQTLITNYLVGQGIEEIRLGTPAGNNVMRFSAQIVSAYPGLAGFTQVYDDASLPTHYGPDVLDMAEMYPYTGPIAVLTNSGAANVLSLTASPTSDSAPGGQYVSLLRQFRDYARFMPSAGGPNIYVTLGEATWSAVAMATWTQGNWVLTAGGPVVPLWNSSAEFPSWIIIGPSH